MNNELKNSVEFIKSKAGKKTGFSTPTNYFNGLDEVIETIISEEIIPAETNFKTPDNYFNSLEDKILDKVSIPKKVTKVISLKDRIYKVIPYTAAASIILFIGLNSSIFSNSSSISIDSLSENDLEYWMESNTLYANDISEVLDDDILDEADFTFAELKDENIEDYIILNDNASLINELK